MEKKPLSSQLKFWYGLGDFGFNLMTNVETFYWNAFLTNVAGFSVGLTGTVTTIATTVDACLSWVYGGLINTLKPGKYGRYRTWFIKINWIVPFLYVFQFVRVSDNDTVSAVVCCIAAIVSHIVWNMSYCTNVAMIAVASQGDPQNRTILASSRATWNNLAGVAYSYVMTGLTAILPKAITENGYTYGAAAFLFACVMVIGMFVHFKITDGYEEIEDPNNPKTFEKTATPVDMLKGAVQNPHLIMLIIADLAKWICKFLVGSSAVYYFTYAMGTGFQANYVLFSNIFCIIMAFCTKYISKKLGNKKTFILALVWMIVCYGIAYFMFANATAVFVLTILAMGGYGIAYTMSPALYADAAVYSKWKSGKDSTGFITGLQNLPLKGAVMLKSILLNLALGLASYDAYKGGINEALANKTIADFAQTLPAELKQGICGAFCLFPALFCVVGLVCFIVGYKLDNEKIIEMQAEIDAR